MTMRTGMARPIRLRLPAVGRYVALASALTILFSTLLIGLAIVGEPSSASGPLSAVVAISTVTIGFGMLIVPVLWVPLFAKLHLWCSVAVAKTVRDEDEEPRVDVVRKVSILPFEKAQVGLQIALLPLIVTVSTGLTILVRTGIADIGALDILALIGISCAALVLAMEITARRATERSRTLSPETIVETVGTNNVMRYVLVDLEEQLGEFGQQRTWPRSLILFPLFCLWLAMLALLVC